MEIKLKQTTVK